MRQYNNETISFCNKFIKRAFDITVSFIGLCFSWWLIFIAWLVATIETRSNGFFIQERIGLHGKPFKVIKIKTMYQRKEIGSSVTTVNDARISKSGNFFRRSKIDELPQLINVLLGEMSFVGPRPDVAGFADNLSPEDQVVLTIRPGITGPATLKYRDEESLLAEQENAEVYNLEVIYPDKIMINKQYIANYSFIQDLRYIILTIFK